MLHGHPVKLLLDSGVSGNFINGSFINRLKMDQYNRKKLDIKDIEEKNIKLADGSTIKSNQLVSNVDTLINEKNIKNSFIILSRLNSKFDGILGMPFLTTANPDVNWSYKSLNWREVKPNTKTVGKFESKNSFIELNSLDSEDEVNCKSATQLKRMHRLKIGYEMRKESFII